MKNLKDKTNMRAKLPIQAEREMEQLLQENPLTPVEDLEAVLIKYRVKSDPKKLAARDRKLRAQRFARRYRDEDGCRDILAHLDRESKRVYYVTIENCTDIEILNTIAERLRMNIKGLYNSMGKARRRKDLLLMRQQQYKLTPRPKKKKTPTDREGSKE